MDNVEDPEVWIIRHRITGDTFVANSGKTSWKKPAHAKNAWGTMCGWYYGDKEAVEKVCKPLGVEPVEAKWKSSGDTKWDFPKFSQQDTWEVVKLPTKKDSKIERANELLTMCLGRLEDIHLEAKILKYLEEDKA